MSDDGPFRKLPTISLPKSTDDRLTAYATLRAKMLFGCYRKGEVADPDVYIRAAAAVLLGYSTVIMQTVTHPQSGLPGRSQFLPTIKEIRDACEAMAEPERQRAVRERRQAEQIAARDAYDRARRPTYQQLQAKYGKTFGLGERKETPEQIKAPCPSWDEIRDFYTNHPDRWHALVRPREEGTF